MLFTSSVCIAPTLLLLNPTSPLCYAIHALRSILLCIVKMAEPRPGRSTYLLTSLGNKDIRYISKNCRLLETLPWPSFSKAK